jgi:hypothetical protein
LTRSSADGHTPNEQLEVNDAELPLFIVAPEIAYAFDRLLNEPPSSPVALEGPTLPFPLIVAEVVVPLIVMPLFGLAKSFEPESWLLVAAVGCMVTWLFHVVDESEPLIAPVAFPVLAKSGLPLALDVAAVPAVCVVELLPIVMPEREPSIARPLLGLAKSLDDADPGTWFVVALATVADDTVPLGAPCALDVVPKSLLPPTAELVAVPAFWFWLVLATLAVAS